MENINEKIKKLLSLASSDNKNEAEMALKKANELMLKFNIERESLEYSQRNYVREDIFLGLKRPAHVVDIAIILQDYFFVTCVLTKGVAGGTSIAIMGEKENVETAVYTFHSLTSTFRALGKGIRAKGHFYQGLREGFCCILNEQKRAVEKEKGLVVVKDQGIEKFKHQEFKRLGKTKSNYKEDNSAYGDGFNKGKNIRIKKAVTSNSKQTKYLS